ncbi:MAG: oxidoreductase [Acidobacteriaceae bacterium]|jgi:NAD(P)-dependent dehydrogenase (short-subunit alcohol dehydrogenase family)
MTGTSRLAAPKVGTGWTTAQIPSQAGRRALVTGANSGIGYHTALELARAGAHVLLACRDRAKGLAALARLRAETVDASAELVLLDLASLASVRQVAAAEAARGLPLDLLINNAGVMAPKRRQQTADGFELQFGTNVLGHFALTALLLPALELAAVGSPRRPRVVTVASIAHKGGHLDFDDLQSAGHYSPMRAYRQSKLANLMLAFEIDRRLRAAGPPDSDVMSVAAHPGVASTNIFRVGPFNPVERWMRRWVGALIGVVLNSGPDGALPTLFAATAPEAVDGGYYGPQGFAEMRGGDVGPAKVALQALDQAAAARLWSECERLTGISLL